MCISEKIVIAICGGSCTGKSTVAEILAKLHAMPVRHCGAIARRAAETLRASVNDLTDDCHRRIDSETVDWVRKARQWSIVEGRYVDQVLGSLSTTVLVVKFHTVAATRATRCQQKTHRTCTVADIDRLDSDDEAFRVRLYKGVRLLQPAFTIDTTFLTPEEVANCLTQRINATKGGHD